MQIGSHETVTRPAYGMGAADSAILFRMSDHYARQIGRTSSLTTASSCDPAALVVRPDRTRASGMAHCTAIG